MRRRFGMKPLAPLPRVETPKPQDRQVTARPPQTLQPRRIDGERVTFYMPPPELDGGLSMSDALAATLRDGFRRFIDERTTFSVAVDELATERASDVLRGRMRNTTDQTLGPLRDRMISEQELSEMTERFVRAINGDRSQDDETS